MAEVRLVDLEIIKRYSLAVRQEKARAEDLIAALDASRAAVVAAMGTSSSSKGRRSRGKAEDQAAAEVAAPVEPTPDPDADHDVLDRFDHVDHLDQLEGLGDVDEQVAS